MEEAADPQLTTSSFQVVAENDKVSHESPLLQTEKSQSPQLLPIRHVRPALAVISLTA